MQSLNNEWIKKKIVKMRWQKPQNKPMKNETVKQNSTRIILKQPQINASFFSVKLFFFVAVASRTAPVNPIWLYVFSLDQKLQ